MPCCVLGHSGFGGLSWWLYCFILLISLAWGIVLGWALLARAAGMLLPTAWCWAPPAWHREQAPHPRKWRRRAAPDALRQGGEIAAASLSSAVHAKDDLRRVAKALGLAFSPKKGEQDAQQVLRLLSALPFNAGGGVSWGPRWVVGGSGCGGGGGGEDAHLKLLRNTEVGHSNKKASSMILASALIPQPNLTTALVAKLRGLRLACDR